MCFKDNNLINDIPFMLFMEEQEQAQREKELAKENFSAAAFDTIELAKEYTNRRDRF